MGSGSNGYKNNSNYVSSRNIEKPRTSPLENMNNKLRETKIHQAMNQIEGNYVSENNLQLMDFHLKETSLIEKNNSLEDQKKNISDLHELKLTSKKNENNEFNPQIHTLHNNPQNIAPFDKVGKPPIYPKSLVKSITPSLNDNINISETKIRNNTEYQKEDLKIAVENNNIELVTKLLSKFEYNESDLKLTNGQTILHIASRLNYSKIIQVL